jgi:hypothetical protein
MPLEPWECEPAAEAAPDSASIRPKATANANKRGILRILLVTSQQG